MDENQTDATEAQSETSSLPRKVLIVSAAVAGLIIAGGFAHFKKKTVAEDEETEPATEPEA